ncbi:HK97 gp10 family phage protein [Roseomonas terrae]|uniref:HK97 gp10 family phage protein n=1 Tax=Neoroseomonas terrae TaxID=424799 RepID=A0ABS5EH68_9PROT|nr:HK97 gp10 family phage protein [Neoroseomonas terrae]MBR0650374.1 HK97 gp10 family phage protein [Neoroseomonas terrae]
MSETVHIRYEDAAFRSLAARAPEIFAGELVPAVTEASLFAEREVKERTPTSGAGTLRDSIGALPVTISGTAITGGVGTSLSYAAAVELGSKPHWAPIAPLLDWVQRKLGLTGEEAESAAQAIQFKIAARGTEGQFMFRDGFAHVEPFVRGLLKAASERAAARMSAE